MREENERKFCHISKGVHGYDVPRYGEYEDDVLNKPWWTLRKEHNKDPIYKSHALLMQDRKLHAKNE